MWVLLCLLVGPTASAAEEPQTTPSRFLWVTRFDYRTEADIVSIVERSAAFGFDSLLFQVRGNATAFYRSSFEPWAEQLEWRDPGFDPLAVALREARAHGLQLHAWVNVVPGWWGEEPPQNVEHLYYKRPEWFWYDQNGKRQPLCERFYVSLNPCLPAVRRHLASVVGEIAAQYDVDGIHLDYIRFPNEPPAVPADGSRDYPRDPGTLRAFARVSGGSPDEHPQAWDAWRTDQITKLLAELRAAVRREKPSAVLSAAVGADPERALEHHQDAVGWLERGLLDVVFPMNYTADDALFRERCRAWEERVGPSTRLVMGTMVAQGDAQRRARQVEFLVERRQAFAVFAYAGLFDSSNGTLDGQTEAFSSERAERRRHLAPVLGSSRPTEARARR